MKRNYRIKNKYIPKRILPFLISAGIILQPVSAFAAEKYSGSFHVNQFGKYYVNADVTVDNNVISDVEISGDGFGGTHADINKMKLQSATEGMKDKFIGLNSDDIDSINDIDVVSGATISSNAIKGAVKDALSLEDDKVDVNVPSKVPEKGEYNVTVSVRSDVVDHSLVRYDTADAKLIVDEKGGMKLKYTNVSGTKEEPMYILGFNGYYIDNDPSKGLSMEGVEYKTDKVGDYTVVTDVEFPLQGLSAQYFVNSKVYVPAMSNVDGNVSGIEFDHGKFDVKTFVNVFWDTLSTGTKKEKTTTITASVEEKGTSPDYVVVIPDKIEMGSLSSKSDSEMKYVVKVDTNDKEGQIVVTSPEKGNLYCKNNSLPFTNEFGRQVKDSSMGESLDFPGKIIIYADDIAKAKPGNYTGTVTFNISYTPKDGGGADIPVAPVDPQGPDEPVDPQGPDESVDPENLKDGVYLVSGNIVKPDKKTLSMADKGINHTLKLTVKNKVPYISIDFKGIKVGDDLGYLGEISYFETGYTEDEYGYPNGETKKATIESYQTDEKGNRVKDKYGTNYPDIVTFPLIEECLDDGFAPIELYIPIMEAISAGAGEQKAYLMLDWTTLEVADSENPVIPEEPSNPEDNNDNKNNQGDGLNHDKLPGPKPGIGNNTLGNNSLGNNSLGNKNSLTKKGVKTGDEVTTLGLWAGLILLSGSVIIFTYKAKRKDKRN